MMKLTRKIKAVATSALALACLSLSGPSQAADAALIAAATKEGAVIWYSTLVQNQAARPLADAFEKKYPGIKASIVAGTQDELLLKLLAEGRAGAIQADVSHGGSAAVALAKAGLVEKYLPESAKDYPAAYKDPDGYWTAETVYYLVSAINTDLVKPADVPKSYADLLDAKWKGKIAWAQQMSQGGPPAFIGMILATMGQDKGMDYLRQLSRQGVVNVVGNQRVVLDQVIGGQYPLALMTFNHHSEISLKKGAPVAWLKLDSAVANLDAAFLMKGAPHPNAGKLFLDFVLSADGQAVLRDADYIPANPLVAATISGLKPETGNFKVFAIVPTMLDAAMPGWIQVYNELFK